MVQSDGLKPKYSPLEMLVFIPHGLDTFWMFILSWGGSKFMARCELITACEMGEVNEGAECNLSDIHALAIPCRKVLTLS